MKCKNGTAVVSVKTAEFRVKEAGPDDGLAEGEFIAYASVFGNVDSYGDIVEPDAFDRTLEEWKASGDVIPVLWGHDTFDPFNNIGGLHSAEPIKPGAEDAKADGEKYGLKVHGFLDIAENPTAAQVYRLMKGRRTTKMSFAYAVRDEKQDDAGNHLNDLDLFEVSIVQIPANAEAEVLTVKHYTETLLKRGRVLSAKNERSLREARDAIDAVLASLGTEDEDDDKSSPAAEASGTTSVKSPVSDEDPHGDKSGASDEEPKSIPSVEAWEAELAFYTTAFNAGKD